MNTTVAVYAGIILLSTLIASVSQVMLKKSALKTYDSPLKEYLNPLVIVAYVLFVGTTLLSVIAYRGIPLSLGPVLEATGYVYVTVFGVLIFKERMTPRKVLALALIVVGIAIYAFGL